ncbi:MAG: methionine biosynthesis protein MetW [Solirubrobacteraceae bacterium]
MLTTLARYQFDVILPVTRTSVLDVGCGHGDLLMYQRSRGSTVVGIERGGVAAASGRQEGLEVHEDLEHAVLPPETFSDVVMQHSL